MTQRHVLIQCEVRYGGSDGDRDVFLVWARINGMAATTAQDGAQKEVKAYGRQQNTTLYRSQEEELGAVVCALDEPADGDNGTAPIRLGAQQKPGIHGDIFNMP